MSKLSNPDHDVAIEFAAKYLECLSVTVAAEETGIEFGSRGAGYYVYFLVCPDSGYLYYVGKGVRDRLNDHYRQYLRGEAVSAKKLEAFDGLAARGLKPKAVVFADGMNESQAYRLERRLICRIGTDNLCNTSPGGYSEDERLMMECHSLLRRLRPIDEWRAIRHEGVSDALYWEFVEEIQEMQSILAEKMQEAA